MLDALARRLSRVSSTRSAALIRIALVLQLWVRFGEFWVPFRYTLDPLRVLTGANFWIATTLLLVGFRTRLASVWTAVVLVGAYYAFGVFGDGTLDLVHHHTWALILCTTWLVLTPCGHSFSVDRYLTVRRAHAAGEALPEERAPDWGLIAIAMQLTAIYWWSAWDKTGWAFLSGERLEVIFVHAYTGFRVPGFAPSRPSPRGSWCSSSLRFPWASPCAGSSASRPSWASPCTP